MSGALILLLPMLVLSVVLLFAFAGCGLDVVGKAPITPPGTTPPPETPPTYKDAILKTPGLVAYWRLGETKLPADPYPAAKDEGANQLFGTYNGPVVLGSVDGAIVKTEPADKAATFNGDGYVEVAWKPVLSPMQGQSFSLEAWIQPGALASPGVEQHVVSFRDIAGTLNTGFEINLVRNAGTSRIQGRVGTGGGADDAIEAFLDLPDAELGPGKDWKHVVMTYDGADPGTLTLYVNADANGPDQKKTPVAYGPNAQQPFRIGCGRTPASAAPGQFYAGAIDEVALYNAALDVSMVKTHFERSGR